MICKQLSTKKGRPCRGLGAPVVLVAALLAACSGLPSRPAPHLSSLPGEAPSAHALATRDADPVPAHLLADHQAPGNVPMADDDAEATMVDPITLDAQALNRFGDLWATLRASDDIAVADQERVRAQQAWFSGHQAYIDRMCARASRYLAYTVAQAQARHMPPELALLPVIESAYDPFAVSSAQATGIWQFVPGTAQVYGLRLSWWYDGRRDIIDSTAAAYTFLGDLYRKYHDWNLVLAAYNAGPGVIDRAIARNQAEHRPTDYWSLTLPAETMAYVPRFLAVLDIVRHNEAFGVHLSPIVNQPYFRSITLTRPIDLKAVADLSGIDLQELSLLNPGLRHEASDPQSAQHLLVPAKTPPSFDLALQQLPEPKRMATRSYRVRRGDTIYHIARRFGMDVAQLRSLNHLHGISLHRGQTLQVAVAEGEAVTHHTLATRQLASSHGHDRRCIRYAVRRGDTLFSISRRYRVSVGDIKSWNHQHHKLHPGQDLVIYVATNDDNS